MEKYRLLIFTVLTLTPCITPPTCIGKSYAPAAGDGRPRNPVTFETSRPGRRQLRATFIKNKNKDNH